MAGIRDIAKAAEVKPEDVSSVFEAVFKLVKKGETVRVSGFGHFNKRKHPGRTLASPVINDGEPTSFGPSYRIAFKQSEQCKRRLNRRKKKAAESATTTKKKGKKKSTKKGKKRK